MHQHSGSQVSNYWLIQIGCLIWLGTLSSEASGQQDSSSSGTLVETATVSPPKLERPKDPTPYEFDPYQVRIWLFSDQPEYLRKWNFREQLWSELDRRVGGAWKTEFPEIPARFAGLVRRDFGNLDFVKMTDDDLIMVVNANTEIGRPVRTPQIAADTLKKIPTTLEAMDVLTASPDTGVRSLTKKLQPVPGAGEAVLEQWGQPDVIAMVIPRGLLDDLIRLLPPRTPAPRIVELPVENQFADIAAGLDKLFVVRVTAGVLPMRVEAFEIDGKLQITGLVATETAIDASELPIAAGRAIFRAFAPVVRIENAGSKTAKGRMRAAGLAPQENSPIEVRVNDSLQPWQRKEDRSGRVNVSLLDWTYGVVTNVSSPKLEMDIHSGRSGGLQGKQSKRTERFAIFCRNRGQATVLRLHARGNADSPMAGYEVYEKGLVSKEMTLVGRTNWDGRLSISATESPLRLLYIKNGGNVLARLPMVPGLFLKETADLIGDDARLRAEAYLKGVENSIVDLVAIRMLFKVRIQARLDKRQLKEARELFDELRKQPTYSTIDNDMSSKGRTIRSKNSIEQKKIDSMFAKTRDLLVTQINEKMIKELEIEIVDAEKGVFKDREPPKKK